MTVAKCLERQGSWRDTLTLCTLGLSLSSARFVTKCSASQSTEMPTSKTSIRFHLSKLEYVVKLICDKKLFTHGSFLGVPSIMIYRNILSKLSSVIWFSFNKYIIFAMFLPEGRRSSFCRPSFPFEGRPLVSVETLPPPTRSWESEAGISVQQFFYAYSFSRK